jgi:hypothetical protein
VHFTDEITISQNRRLKQFSAPFSISNAKLSPIASCRPSLGLRFHAYYTVI